MKQTIFNTYVLMQSQSDCDEAKAICEKYGLPKWDDKIAFKYFVLVGNFFSSNYDDKEFGVWEQCLRNKTEVTLTRFKELCEEWKKLNE